MRGLTLNLGGDRSTLQVSISRNDANRYIDGSDQEAVLKCVYLRVGGIGQRIGAVRVVNIA